MAKNRQTKADDAEKEPDEQVQDDGQQSQSAETVAKVLNPQNPDDLPRHQGADRAPGAVEGPDGDRRRRAEQAIHAENQRAAAAPGLDAQKRRHRALDDIEKAIKRHEFYYEDFVGGLLLSVPPRTPMELHEMRLAALRVQNNPTSGIKDLENATAELEAIEFTPALNPTNPDLAPAPGKDDGGSA